MLGVGISVRLLGAAAAPRPPAPVPPGKPPLPLSSPDLRRRSSGWRFSNGNPNSATTSSRAARRKWWSDPEPDQQDYGYYGSSSLDDDEEDYEDEDEAGFSGFGGARELFDEPWFTKVFKTYGYLLPVMLASMLIANGPKAFLMAMAIPLGQSAISFLLDTIWGSRTSDREDRWRRQTQPFQEDDDDGYTEDTTDFAESGRGNGYSSRSNYYEGRRRQDSYQSWVSNGSAYAAGADDNSTKSSGSSRGGGGGKESGGGFGGWDELLDNDYAREKKSSNSFSAGNTDYSKRSQAAAIGQEDADAAAAAARGGVGQGLGAAPPTRARAMPRRRRMPRTMGLSSSRYKQAPLLMRLLVAVFPFLGSWFRML